MSNYVVDSEWCGNSTLVNTAVSSFSSSVFGGNDDFAKAWVETVCATQNGTNYTFILVSAYLVFFMQTGFAMLCAGSVRTKNTMNILIKHVLDACAGALAYYICGYAFAYGESANRFIGHSQFCLAGIDKTEFNWSFYLFQWAFAAAPATIVSGSVAERTQCRAYLAYSVFLTAFVYPVVSHWAWSQDGWLSIGRSTDVLFNSGYIDFAGSGVVHMTGGLSGLAGASIVGARMGRFNEDGKPAQIRGHSASLVVLGTLVLWIGWYGFNPGSTLAIAYPGYYNIASRTAVTTTLSAAAGGVATLLYQYFRYHVYDLIAVCNGILGGLVGITAGCSVVEPWAAIIIGGISAMVIQGMDHVLLRFKVDDPLQAIHIHGFCGIWGVFVVGIIATEKYVQQVYGTENRGNYYGLFYGGGGNLLACQVIGILAISGWTLGLMIPFFFLLNRYGYLRCSTEVEQIGLDISKHGGSAYAFDMGVDPTTMSI